jgi:DegV family protein with EDD domain
MAQNIGFVVDSAVDLPLGMAEQLDLHIVPVHITVDGRDYLHGVTISDQEIIAHLRREREVKTAPPFPSEFGDLYERIGRRYDRILSFHVSSELSNCYNSAKNSLRILYEDIAEKVNIIDTKNVSIGQGLIVKRAVELVNDRGDLNNLEAMLAPYVRNAFLYFSVENLYWLRRAGKTGVLSSLFGKALDIKPVIGLEDGRLVPVSRSRGKKSAIDDLVRLAREAYQIYQGRHETWIAHADAFGSALYLQEALSSQLHIDAEEIQIVDIGPTISAHTGPGCVCLAMIPAA